MANRHIADNWQRLRLNEIMKAEFLVGFTNWSTIYYLYIDELTRTPSVIARIANRYEDMHHRLQVFINQIKNDANVTLTKQDKSVFGVP